LRYCIFYFFIFALQHYIGFLFLPIISEQNRAFS